MRYVVGDAALLGAKQLSKTDEEILGSTSRCGTSSSGGLVESAP
jgi:hypothetical protein